MIEWLSEWWLLEFWDITLLVGVFFLLYRDHYRDSLANYNKWNNKWPPVIWGLMTFVMLIAVAGGLTEWWLGAMCAGVFLLGLLKSKLSKKWFGVIFSLISSLILLCLTAYSVYFLFAGPPSASPLHGKSPLIVVPCTLVGSLFFGGLAVGMAMFFWEEIWKAPPPKSDNSESSDE